MQAYCLRERVVLDTGWLSSVSFRHEGFSSGESPLEVKLSIAHVASQHSRYARRDWSRSR